MLGAIENGAAITGGAGQNVSAGFYAGLQASLYPDSHNTSGQGYSAILGAIGYVLDSMDPIAMSLSREFSVTTATGSALDAHGADWGVQRRSGEADGAYRSRILAMLPVYANGASDTGITSAIAVFTGATPTVIDTSSDGWSCLDSACLDSAMSDLAGLFSLYIYVQNPNGIAYNHYDMENALRTGLPSRSRAVLAHNGTDTSPLNEAYNAVVTVIG